MFFRLGRSVRVSSNSRRALQRGFVNAFKVATPPLDAPSAAIGEELDAPVALETALVVGAGPGFGFALARRLAMAGMRVAVAARNAERLDSLVEEISSNGGIAHAYGCDARDEDSIAELMLRVRTDLGVPHLVVYAVQGYCPGRVLDVEVAEFEESWRQNCLGGFIVAREAARLMVELGRGTIVLTGSTSSLIGRAGHLNLAVGKFGLRALAQVLSREIWPAGVHVAHIVIDADIQERGTGDSSPQADPEHLASAVLELHRQPRTTWTSEIDFRPWNEKFWEHC